jgi:hypothetical protein
MRRGWRKTEEKRRKKLNVICIRSTDQTENGGEGRKSTIVESTFPILSSGNHSNPKHWGK